ncbi:hypothetical protein FISHEDRAFT_40769, partial [Fistulina hepatica ATCC 64428]
SATGDKLYEVGRCDAAKESYLGEIRAIIGQEVFTMPGLPEQGVRRETYVKLDPINITTLMGCCVGMARCLYKEDELEAALWFLEEVSVLERNIYYAAPRPLYDWEPHGVNLPEMSRQISNAMTFASDIFLALGNTGASVDRRWMASYESGHFPQEHFDKLALMNQRGSMSTMMQFRHPDPERSPGQRLSHARLQVWGSWLRLHVKRPPSGSLDRFGHTCFIWKSRLFVAGGRKDSLGPFYRDLWCLDLQRLDSWRRLSDYPLPFGKTNIWVGWSTIPYENKAWMFNGRLDVDYFDLVEERWGSVRTTFEPTPADRKAGLTEKRFYPSSFVQDAAVQIIAGKMYVFGGTHRETNLGCNLFMELDLRTKTWRRLSGTPMTPAQAEDCPGPRRSAACWTNKEQDKFYLMFGQCDRHAAPNEPQAGEKEHAYKDMWIWLIREERWIRDRLSGNTPSSRAEMAYTYNPKLDRAIIFSGYNCELPTFVQGMAAPFNFTYYSDTFIYGHYPVERQAELGPPTMPKWKQVLTFGFPTYRCQAQLVSDPDTGKTYMWGGFTNSDYVPVRAGLVTRSFSDLWQLRIDEPGGCFEGIDLEEEVRTARAGPWQRCFACGAAGRCKKCGGTCNGRVYFCGPVCLKEGWKEHKQMHKCRKNA